MAEKKPQNYANHTRRDPPFHFYLLPIFGLGLVLTLIHFFYHFSHSDSRDNIHAFLLILLAIAFIVLTAKSRLYALKVQDRIIRLEERLRFAALLPPDLLTRSKALTESQYIALRFASDDELPALVKRTLDENLTSKQIKESINTWRPDYFRV